MSMHPRTRLVKPAPFQRMPVAIFYTALKATCPEREPTDNGAAVPYCEQKRLVRIRRWQIESGT
jgi:hypothetical protein